MEQVARQLGAEDAWPYRGGNAKARKPLSVVVRAFDGDVLLATGETDAAPDGEGTRVPRGQGRRLEGRHFFARPASPVGPRLVTYRGF